MIRTILAWLRGPLAASTEADYAGPGEDGPLHDYLAEARSEADRILTIEARCYNAETRRALRAHFYGRKEKREPRCLNCGTPRPSLVVAE